MPSKGFAAYVLVSVDAGDVAVVRDRLLEEPHILLAHALIGPDDLLVYVEVETPAHFIAVIDRDVRRLIEGGLVTRTETLPVLDDARRTDHTESPGAMTAWVLCEIDVGDPRAVLDALRMTRGVVQAHAVLGRYDVVCRLEGRDHQELMEVIASGIRPTAGIRRTDTRYIRQGRAAREGSPAGGHPGEPPRNHASRPAEAAQ